MVILSHPTGNSNVRAALRALASAGLLEAFFTTLGFSSDRAVVKFLPPALRLQLERRGYREIPAERLRLFPWREMVRLAAARMKLNSLVRHEHGWASVDAVYRSLDAHVAAQIREKRVSAPVVYAYEDAALATFRAARERGVQCVYELPTAYWATVRRLSEEERDLQPEWASTLQSLYDTRDKLERKDEELRLSGRIIVASTFTRRSLEQGLKTTAPVHVVPYGAPAVDGAPLSPSVYGQPLRALFVGRLVQLKGLSYLFEAMARVGACCTLTVLGPRPEVECKRLESALQHHRWLAPVPHARVFEIMAQHDVLVFPSLIEGFGAVILEAMSRGLPVITTPNTAGPDLIEEGIDGYIVPIRDADAIAERLTALAEDRSRLAAMADAARRKAAGLPWERYERRLAGLMADCVYERR